MKKNPAKERQPLRGPKAEKPRAGTSLRASAHTKEKITRPGTATSGSTRGGGPGAGILGLKSLPHPEEGGRRTAEHTFTQERRNLPRPAGPSLHSLLSAAAPAPASASGKKAPAERQGRGFRAGPALSAAGRRVRGGGGGGGGRPDVRGGEGPRRWPGSALLRTLKLLLFVFLSFFLFFPRRTCGIWKFPLGGRANKSRSCDLHHSCGRGSLPPAAPGGQPRQPRRTATPGPTAPGPGPALRQSQPGSLPRRRRRTTPATAAFKGSWNRKLYHTLVHEEL